ncbi:hypothetical protein PGTUg99_025189 [Puccinia graminis f. sp. tritici]|uniref:Uncharacterized protein n=1 Tax=Puccinia graminis f. sp. tritici TaxID=56615 RepID=A0A5B0PLW1_PUCGR|nr:hypothetical protein PGTUg99_025189 [Puccinia graminis f. sp. tritici]
MTVAQSFRINNQQRWKRSTNDSPSPAPDTPGRRTRVTTRATSGASQAAAPDTPGLRTSMKTKLTHRESLSGPIWPTVCCSQGNVGRLPACPKRGASSTLPDQTGRGTS